VLRVGAFGQLLELALELRIGREEDVHDLLVGGEYLDPLGGVVRGGDAPRGLLGKGGAVGRVDVAVVGVELGAEASRGAIVVDAEHPTAAVVDIDVAVPDLQAERVVVADPLEHGKQHPRGEMPYELR